MTHKPKGRLSEFNYGRIIGAFEDGASVTAISERYSIPNRTVRDVIVRYNETGTITAKKPTGRRKKDKLAESMETTGAVESTESTQQIELQ
ncbi:hypothetical protein K501DRAFT_286573 [Backusella circina FSU 941]|nr:hypothetical protein K501DRAFT_289650 [Backusella circina FSU 941]KAI8881037.1 hypothetical protein K501DRAFT_286573 [Backusella circina FSU 941]